MRKPLRFGLLGAGYIANKAIGPAINSSPLTELVAVASHRFEDALAFAEKFGGEALKDYKKVINHPQVEAVYISLPNALHFEWIVKAAKVRKHVICDKPAVLSFAQAQKVVEICHRHRVRFLEAYMFRFHPQHQIIKKLIKQGQLGKIHHFEAAFGFPPLDPQNFRYKKSLGGGAFNDAYGYLVSAARMIFDEEPIEGKLILHRPPNQEVETRGAALLNFPDGRSAQLTFGFDYFYRNYYTIWGSEGLLTLEPALTIPPDKPATITLKTIEGSKTLTTSPADQFRLMIEAFARTVVNQTKNRDKFEQEFLDQAKALELLKKSL